MYGYGRVKNPVLGADPRQEGKGTDIHLVSHDLSRLDEGGDRQRGRRELPCVGGAGRGGRADEKQ